MINLTHLCIILLCVFENNCVLSAVELSNGTSFKQNLANSPKISNSNGIFDYFLDVYAPVSKSFDNDLCRNHSLLFKSGVKSRTFWAVSMLDASAKIPSGMLTGNNIQLGNYEECLELENIESEYGRFSGQFCGVTIGYPSLYGPDLDDVPMIHALWMMCIPSSCSANDLELHLKATLKRVMGKITIRVLDSSCFSRADPSEPITADVYVALSVTLLTVVLVFIGTALDLVAKEDVVRSRGLELILAFSLYTNGKKLLNVSHVSDSLRSLDGLRVVCMVWLVAVHTNNEFLLSSLINKNNAMQIRIDWRHIFLYFGTFCVDLFLLYGGTLVCYNFLKERSKGVQFNLFRYYVQRYIRRPSYGKPLLGVSIIVGLVLAFQNAYAYQLPVFCNTVQGEGSISQYFHTHNRFTPWLIGVGLGYLLHITKGNPVRLPRGVVISGWVLSAALVLGTFISSNIFVQPGHQYYRIASSMYHSLSRPGIALGVAWIVFACERGYGGYLKTFLCWNVFPVLSQLCYGVYMSHSVLLQVNNGTAKNTFRHYNDFAMYMEIAGILVFSVLASIVLSLTVEMPAINIGKKLLAVQTRNVKQP